MNPVAILGGGITGLTAAYELRKREIPFVLFEAGSRVGGVIRTHHQEGFLAECGPNTLLNTSPKIGELIRNLGLEPNRLETNPAARNRYIVRAGRPVPMPLSPFQFLGSELFSLGTKMRLLTEPFRARAAANKEESLAEFTVRRLGSEFLDYAINPFIAGVYAGDPRRLSVKHALPKLYALEQKYGSLIKGQILGACARKKRGTIAKNKAKMISFDRGLQVLTDALGRHLAESIRLNASIVALEKTESGWQIQEMQAQPDTPKNFSAVLLTAPAHRLAKLKIHDQNNINLSRLSEIYYPPVSSVVLGFHRQDVAHPLDGFGMLIPEVENFHILGAIFSSSLFPHRAPEGQVTLTCYLGGVRAPELALQDTEKIVRMTLADLSELLGVRGRPCFTHHSTYPKAIPQYEVGYGRFKDFMNEFENAHPGLLLAGHFRDGISLSDSILAGFNAAERIAAR